jgi:hypothetical protein
VNYIFRIIYSISATRHSVFPIFQCYGSSSSCPHMEQPNISLQDTECVLRSFLQSNKLLNTRKCGAFHPVHRVWCAYASQDATPPSLYVPACHCRWQVKVVWNHDTVWKAGNGQPFYLIKSCLMVTSVRVRGIHTDFMWHNYDYWVFFVSVFCMQLLM